MAFAQQVLFVRSRAGASVVSQLILGLATTNLVAMSIAVFLMTGTLSAFDQNLLIEPTIHSPLTSPINLYVSIIARTLQVALLSAMESMALEVTLVALDIQMLVRLALLCGLALMSDSYVTVLADTHLLLSSAAMMFAILIGSIVAPAVFMLAVIFINDFGHLVFVTMSHWQALAVNCDVSWAAHTDLTASLEAIGVPLEDIVGGAFLANGFSYLIVVAFAGLLAIVSNSDVATLADTLLAALGIAGVGITCITILALDLSNLVTTATNGLLALVSKQNVSRVAHTDLFAPLLAVGVVASEAVGTLCVRDRMVTTVLDGLAFTSNKLITWLADTLLLADLVAVRMARIAVLVALGLNHLIAATFSNQLAFPIDRRHA